MDKLNKLKLLCRSKEYVWQAAEFLAEEITKEIFLPKKQKDKK